MPSCGQSVFRRVLLGSTLGLLGLALPLPAQLPEKLVIRPEGVAAGSAGSPAILAGNTLYTSTHFGTAPDGTRPPAFAEEARAAFAALSRTLAAAAMDIGNVVSLYAYVASPGDLGSVHPILREQLPQKPSPAHSVVGVGRLPGDARIALQAIAVQEGFPRVYHGSPDTASVTVNGVVYLSGVAPDTRAASNRFAIRQALARLGDALRAAGVDYRHVAFVHPFMAPKTRGDLDLVYRQFFEYANTPARATLEMSALPGDVPIVLSAVAAAELERRRAVRPISRELSATASPAVFAGDALYFSGFSGFTPGFGTVSDDFDIQTRLALRNVLDCLESAGLSFDNFVSLNCWLGKLDDSERMLRYVREYFPRNPPALAVIQQSATGPNNRPAVQFSGIAVRSVTAKNR
jgi:enamine deaminase RidA (YjgF/YER057c/UK114 family)